MIDTTYKAMIQFLTEPSLVRCECDGGCNWTGTADQLAPIGEAVLTPGHPSPAGRCPVCDTLAYVAEEEEGEG